jgi:tRNA threonylcarbamoyladenosine biosynthesis protein TsaE
MEFSYHLRDIRQAARLFREKLGHRKVFAFHGDLGAGKTTFIHALCDAAQVSSTVGSPTYSIVNEYISPGGPLYHIDLYRLKDEEEAIRAGVEDYLYAGCDCLVEWPERAPGIFPPDTIQVFIEIVDRETRKIRVESKAQIAPNSI